MSVKTVLITGATSGIGKASASALGRAGYNLIITGRNNKKGEPFAKELKKKFGTEVDFLKADLSTMSEVRDLCKTVKSKYDKIDVLINNAGARFNGFNKSKDGIELTFATNYFGHFLLTLSLFALLKKSESARIINMSSGAHWKYTLEPDKIIEPEIYDRRKAYGQSKLAMILFTYELSKKISSTKITVNALDPGGVATNLGRNNGLIAWAKHYVSYISRGTLVSPSTAAEAVAYLSTAEELQNISGKFFFRKVMIKSSDASYDKKLSDQLWNLSLDTCGLTFNTNT